MAWLERRGERFRIAFRFGGEKFRVNLKASDPREADGCLARREENLRLVERGRLSVPAGADLGRFLLSDGKREKPVEVARRLLGWSPRHWLRDALPKMVAALKADPAGWYAAHGLGSPPG